MKRLILVLILLISTIIFIGCGGNNAQILITEAQKNAPDSLSLSPPKVLIENVSPGVKIDAPPMSLENGTEDDISVIVSIVIPDHETSDITSGLIYQPAPSSKLGIPELELTIPAYSKASIPIRITIPKEVYPPRWEFDIKVTQGGGFVQTALIQRWLITMR